MFLIWIELGNKFNELFMTEFELNIGIKGSRPIDAASYASAVLLLGEEQFGVCLQQIVHLTIQKAFLGLYGITQ